MITSSLFNIHRNDRICSPPGGWRLNTGGGQAQDGGRDKIMVTRKGSLGEGGVGNRSGHKGGKQLGPKKNSTKAVYLRHDLQRIILSRGKIGLGNVREVKQSYEVQGETGDGRLTQR